MYLYLSHKLVKGLKSTPSLKGGAPSLKTGSPGPVTPKGVTAGKSDTPAAPKQKKWGGIEVEYLSQSKYPTPPEGKIGQTDKSWVVPKGFAAKHGLTASGSDAHDDAEDKAEDAETTGDQPDPDVAAKQAAEKKENAKDPLKADKEPAEAVDVESAKESVQESEGPSTFTSTDTDEHADTDALGHYRHAKIAEDLGDAKLAQFHRDQALTKVGNQEPDPSRRGVYHHDLAEKLQAAGMHKEAAQHRKIAAEAVSARVEGHKKDHPPPKNAPPKKLDRFERKAQARKEREARQKQAQKEASEGFKAQNAFDNTVKPDEAERTVLDREAKEKQAQQEASEGFKDQAAQKDQEIAQAQEQAASAEESIADTAAEAEAQSQSLEEVLKEIGPPPKAEPFKAPKPETLEPPDDLKERRDNVAKLHETLAEKKKELRKLRSRASAPKKDMTAVDSAKARFDKAKASVEAFKKKPSKKVFKASQNVKDAERTLATHSALKLKKKSGESDKDFEARASAHLHQKKKFEKEVKQAKSAHKKAVRDHAYNVRRREATLAKHESAYETAKSEAQTAYDKAKEERNKATEDLRAEIENHTADLRDAKTALRAHESEHKAAEQEAHKEVVGEAREAHKAKVNEAKEAHQAKIKEAKESHKAKIKEAKEAAKAEEAAAKKAEKVSAREAKEAAKAEEAQKKAEVRAKLKSNNSKASQRNREAKAKVKAQAAQDKVKAQAAASEGKAAAAEASNDKKAKAKAKAAYSSVMTNYNRGAAVGSRLGSASARPEGAGELASVLDYGARGVVSTGHSLLSPSKKAETKEDQSSTKEDSTMDEIAAKRGGPTAKSLRLWLRS